MVIEKKKGGCLKCPYEGHVVVPPSGNPLDAKLWVVGEAPGTNESYERRPFVGRAGILLWQELAALGVERKDCFVINTCQCQPPRDPSGSNAPVPAAVRHCLVQWEETWAQMKNRIVLLLGNIPCKKFTGRAGSSVRGNVMDDEQGNALLPVFHPAYILRNMGAIYTWRKDIALLMSLFNRRGSRKKAKVSFEVVTTPGAMREAVTYYLAHSSKASFAFDIETTGLMPWEPGAEILSLAVSDGERTCVFDMTILRGRENELKRLLEDEVYTKGKIIQNAKFEVVWLKFLYGIQVKNIIFDPSVGRYLLDEGAGTSVRLKQLVWKYFPQYGGYEAGIDYANMSGLPKDKLYEYNATDAYLTYALFEVMQKECAEQGYDYVLKEVILPAVYPLAEMECEGLKVEREVLVSERKRLERKLEGLERKMMSRPLVREIEDFNITSSHHLRKLFLDKMGLATQYHTVKTRQPAMIKETFVEWEDSGVREAGWVLEHKAASKLLTTYYSSYIEKTATSDGRLHPSYNMMVARSGRLASGNPNIQNVPIEVRRVFRSRFGEEGQILQMDFKQIEMRVMACAAKDKALIEIFKRGGDPHREVAAEILGKSVEDVTDDERKATKAVNFGLYYGMGAATLAEREGLELGWTQNFINMYFRKFKGVKAWQNMIERRARRGEKSVSFFGRKRDLNAYYDMERVKRAYNHPIQSAASDINLYCLGIIWQLMRDLKLKSVMIATVHDSLVVDCLKAEREVVERIMREVVGSLQDTFDWLIVPMEISITAGRDWMEASG